MGFCGQYGHAPSLQLWAHIFRLERVAWKVIIPRSKVITMKQYIFVGLGIIAIVILMAAGGQISPPYNGGSGGAVASVVRAYRSDHCSCR